MGISDAGVELDLEPVLAGDRPGRSSVIGSIERAKQQVVCGTRKLLVPAHAIVRWNDDNDLSVLAKDFSAKLGEEENVVRMTCGRQLRQRYSYSGECVPPQIGSSQFDEFRSCRWGCKYRRRLKRGQTADQKWVNLDVGCRGSQPVSNLLFSLDICLADAAPRIR